MPIQSAALYLTEDCNLRCRYCFVPKKPKRMSLEVGREAIDFMLAAPAKVKRVSIVFFGGEPLLEFDTLRELTLYGEQRSSEIGRQIKFSVTTNGTLVTDEVFEFLTKHNIHMNLSIDGGPKTQNRNRRMADGSGSFDLVERTLDRAIEHNPKKGIRMTFDADSADALYENVQFMWSRGARNLSTVPVVESNWSERMLDIAREQYQHIAEAVLDGMRRDDYRQIGFLGKYIKRITSSERRPRRQCGGGTQYVGISTQGEIYACHRFIGYGGYRFGDLDEVTEPSSREKFLTFNSASLTMCEGCQAKLTCGGGCPAINFECTGDSHRPAPNQCAFIRMQYDISKWLYDVLTAEKSPWLDHILGKGEKSVPRDTCASRPV